MAAQPSPLHQPAFDAVIWDYDGTLVATRFADEAAVAELVRRDPSAAAGAEVFWATEGQPILRRLELAWPGRVAEVLPLFNQRLRPHRLRGVAPVVEELRRRSVPMAVVSSRARGGLEWGLRASGLRPAFDVVVGLEDVGTPKPDPEGLLLAMRRLGLPPSRGVYIGDSEVDLDAGRRAGMTAWRATWATPDGAPPDSPSLVRRPREVLARIVPDEAVD